MKRYSLKHEFAVTEENGTPLRDCSVQIYICERGIDKKQIMDLLTGLTESYSRFLGEESGEQNSIRKGWFLHG